MADSALMYKGIDRLRNVQHRSFTEYLSSAYEVLRKIFSFLSLEELEIVSQAFEKWRPIVETTKKERTIIDALVFDHSDDNCKVWSEAKFCISFYRKEDKALEHKLLKHLIKNSHLPVLETRAGVIGTPSFHSQASQQKSFRDSGFPGDLALATHLRLPNFPGVGIKVFSWQKDISFEQFRNSFKIPESKIIKCLLIFVTLEITNMGQIHTQKDDFVTFLQKSQKESFAMGGCIVDSFLDGKGTGTKYIVFYGDKVEAASIVLKKDVKTKEKIESQVEELKEICPKTKKGVVFIFRCCSRNRISRQPKFRTNLIMWEADAVKKYFPTTPVVGCYGYGEFGKKFPDNDDSQWDVKKPRQSDVWEYTLSTSLVYLGFKK